MEALSCRHSVTDGKPRWLPTSFRAFPESNFSWGQQQQQQQLPHYITLRKVQRRCCEIHSTKTYIEMLADLTRVALAVDLTVLRFGRF